jgi:hypothetical protein
MADWSPPPRQYSKGVTFSGDGSPGFCETNPTGVLPRQTRVGQLYDYLLSFSIDFRYNTSLLKDFAQMGTAQEADFRTIQWWMPAAPICAYSGPVIFDFPDPWRSAVTVRRGGAINRWYLKLHESISEKVDWASKNNYFPAEICSKSALRPNFRPACRWFSVGFQYFSKWTREFAKLCPIDRNQGSEQAQHRQGSGGAKILCFPLRSRCNPPRPRDRPEKVIRPISHPTPVSLPP